MVIGFDNLEVIINFDESCVGGVMGVKIDWRGFKKKVGLNIDFIIRWY